MSREFVDPDAHLGRVEQARQTAQQQAAVVDSRRTPGRFWGIDLPPVAPRIAATVIDIFVAYLLLGPLALLFRQLDVVLPEALLLVLMVVSYMALNVVCIHFFAATPGKLVVGQRVAWASRFERSSNDEPGFILPTDWTQQILRAGVSTVNLFPGCGIPSLVTALVTERKASVADLAVCTVVVKSQSWKALCEYLTMPPARMRPHMEREAVRLGRGTLVNEYGNHPR